jgi:hypothetical protein
MVTAPLRASFMLQRINLLCGLARCTAGLWSVALQRPTGVRLESQRGGPPFATEPAPPTFCFQIRTDEASLWVGGELTVEQFGLGSLDAQDDGPESSSAGAPRKDP